MVIVPPVSHPRQRFISKEVIWCSKQGSEGYTVSFYLLHRSGASYLLEALFVYSVPRCKESNVGRSLVFHASHALCTLKTLHSLTWFIDAKRAIDSDSFCFMRLTLSVP